jgi:type II secretory pathway pseudopilin PulG
MEEYFNYKTKEIVIAIMCIMYLSILISFIYSIYKNNYIKKFDNEVENIYASF